jgi:hypothetical protein
MIEKPAVSYFVAGLNATATVRHSKEVNDVIPEGHIRPGGTGDT